MFLFILSTSQSQSSWFIVHFVHQCVFVNVSMHFTAICTVRFDAEVDFVELILNVCADNEGESNLISQLLTL